jgi:coenzyme F420-reducing hydrogenase delta subunit
MIPVHCASRLTVETLLEPMLKGSRRVLVAACHEGNCRSAVGGRSAAAQLARIVDETRLPAATFGYHSIAANEPAKFAALLSGIQPAE